MREMTGPVGREEPVARVAKALNKGRPLILTDPTGSGQSSVLEAAIENVQAQRPLVVIHITDHQAKGPFVTITRRLLEEGLVKPSERELAKRFDEVPPAELEGAPINRPVNRLSIRDLTAAILPAIHDHDGDILIAVDDMTNPTPTRVAFWLAIPEKARVIGGASQRKRNLAKLRWQMTAIGVPPLAEAPARLIATPYSQKTGMLSEAPARYVSHGGKQANGNPQALADLRDDAGKARVVDKRKIRPMRPAAGVKYLDFTPVVIPGTAFIVGARYRARGSRRQGGKGDQGAAVGEQRAALSAQRDGRSRRPAGADPKRRYRL